MSLTSESTCSHIQEVYNENFISSLDAGKPNERLLRDILRGETSGRKIWRGHLERCLSLANRHRLLDRKDFLSRLRCKDLDVIDAAFGELGSALYFESTGSEVRFQNHNNFAKSPDLTLCSSSGASAFAEVKTLFSEEPDRKHNLATLRLRNLIEEVQLPFAVIIRRVTPDACVRRDSFTKFLEIELRRIGVRASQHLGTLVELPPYRRGRVAIELSAMILPDSPRVRYLGSVHPTMPVEDRKIIYRVLNAKYCQLACSTSANVVVLDVTHRAPIQADDVLTAVYGGNHAEQDSTAQTCTLAGSADGFWCEVRGHSRLGAVMIIRWRITDSSAMPLITVFHNPWARVPVSPDLFGEGSTHYAPEAGSRVVTAVSGSGFC